MTLLERLVEQRLGQAAKEGAFEDLPGSGLPLSLEQNPLEGAWSLAHHLLRSNGFAPRWIELDGEIRAERTALRRKLQEVLSDDDGRAARASVRQQLEERIERHNQRVQLRNQLAPFAARPRLPLDIEQELRRPPRIEGKAHESEAAAT